jgi:hypothetical protein
MKKYILLILLLSVTAVVSAQKMTIKTTNGQKVEISYEGMLPNQVIVVNDSVILKMEAPMVASQATPIAEEVDSVDTFVQVDSAKEENVEEPVDSVITVAPKNLSDSNPSTLSLIADAIAEEVSPEYAEFNKLHENDHPSSEKEVVKNVAKQFLNEDVVETADFITTLLGNIRFTKDSLFRPEYSLRKPKKLVRAYNLIMLSGSLGQNISSIGAGGNKVKEEDYGDDLENNQKWGGGIKYSRVYTRGEEVDGEWKPNPLGFGWSWGGLIDYSYEKDMGSYFNIMGKVGVQIGTDIAFGLDALAGYGIIPYNSFYTNGYQHSVMNKSVFGFKCGLELWGSLNFSKSTYTAVYGRYICSVRPKYDGVSDEDWELVYADFDPSNWTVGMAVGYKFGEPQPLSQEKRLQASINTGFTLTGENEAFISAEIGKMTQVSKSTYLNYGLSVETTLKNNLSSLLLSAGFKVKQPYTSWFWGANLLGGIGQYDVDVVGEKSGTSLETISKKLCAKAALQINTGLSLGKLSEVFAGFRAGYHFGNDLNTEGYDNVSYKNMNSFDLSVLLGYKFTF